MGSLRKVINVKGETPFQVDAESFGLSKSAQGYTLAYSIDGDHYTEYETPVPADEELIVNGVVPGAFFKCIGNTDTIHCLFKR